MFEMNVNVLLHDERIGVTETNLFPVQEVAISNIAQATCHL
jgi:hypothetical protein